MSPELLNRKPLDAENQTSDISKASSHYIIKPKIKHKSIDKASSTQPRSTYQGLSRDASYRVTTTTGYK